MIGSGIDFVRAARRVREHLDQRHRWQHTLGVARTAERLARAHRADVARARVAGLLHDLARLYPAARLLYECEQRGLPIDAFERTHPVVLHARLGAELAHDWFGIDDDAILSAIRKHTVAAAVMSTLDTIVYLADALEPGRDFPARARMLAIAEHDLAAGMRAVLASTVTYLQTRGLTVAPQTTAAIATFDLSPLQEKRTA